MRRVDIEEVLGRIPTPSLETGQHLIDILFSVGPVEKDSPISWQSLESWERRRGIELEPWQADLLMDMSKAYLAETYSAKDWNAIAPWEPARKMWKYVRDQKNGPGLRAALKESVKEQSPNGTRKRH